MVHPVGNMPLVESGGRQFWGYAAAGTLAVLTLGVFYTLQDYGPESAIRRFHSAVASNDPADLQRVTQQDIRSVNVQLLIRQAQGFLRVGSYQLLRMDRDQPGQVQAAVVYKARGTNEIFPMIWVVTKKGAAWKVDADMTVTILRDSLGM